MINVMIHPLLDVVRSLTVFSKGGLRLAGIVTPARIPNGENKGVTVPVAQDVTGTRAWETGRYAELLPNEYYRGVWFFEEAQDVQFIGYGDGNRSDLMYFETDVYLKGWINVKKLNYPAFATARMVLELTSALTEGTSELSRDAGRFAVSASAFTGAHVDVQVLQQQTRTRDVFGRYSNLVPEVTPEFEYFALRLRLRFEVGKNCYFELLPEGERFAIMDTAETGVTDDEGNIIAGFQT